LAEATARAEIHESKQELERRLGRPATVFSYPAGLFGSRERALVEAAGFEAAVTTNFGANDAGTDRFALRRLQIDPSDRLVDFRAKVGGGHDSPLAFQTAYRRLRHGVGARDWALL
jgi:peptidoglycan/xylan/chitin deacetylase (PgdA/CDA1 family)